MTCTQLTGMPGPAGEKHAHRGAQQGATGSDGRADLMSSPGHALQHVTAADWSSQWAGASYLAPAADWSSQWATAAT